MQRVHYPGRDMLALVCSTVFLLLGAPAASGATELNLYSARKENLIRPLLDRFTIETGIKVNILAADGTGLLQRLRAEGVRSPADLLLTVDLGQLTRAAEEGLLQTVRSSILETRIPPAYRDTKRRWYGLSLRVRVIVHNRSMQQKPPANYLELAHPQWQGQLCIRSSNNVYNQSLVAAMLGRYGEIRTRVWLEGVVANFARPPQGGDRDQVRAVAAGLCKIAVVNSYYLGGMLNASLERDVSAARKVALVWPSQQGAGTHVNLGGAGVTRHASHLEQAVALLEFLAGEGAQRWFTTHNYEYPVASAVMPAETLQAWGTFKADTAALATLGQHQEAAVRLMDRVGWR